MRIGGRATACCAGIEASIVPGTFHVLDIVIALHGVHDLPLFVSAGVLLNVTPGVDFLYVVAASTRGGARAGILAALGIGAGCFVHIVAAALGVSTLVAASASAFALVKAAGACYLAYVGLRLIFSRASARATRSADARELRHVFRGGFLTNALNPKVALFFLALVPQFIDASARNAFAPFVLLGAMFDAMGTAWNVVVALAAAAMASRFRTAGAMHARRWLERALGAMFVGLAARLAWSERA